MHAYSAASHNVVLAVSILLLYHPKMVDVIRLTESSPRAAEDLSVLASTLHRTPHVITSEELTAMLAEPHTVLMVARDGGRIIGMGSLFIARIIGGYGAHIEDVIVSENYQRKGIGERILRALIECARERGVRVVKLTSRPSRIAAHRLYEKLGFEKYETTAFKMKLSDSTKQPASN